MYFASNRPGGVIDPNFGVPSLDLWVAMRPDTSSSWGTVIENVFEVNTQYGEYLMSIADDGQEPKPQSAPRKKSVKTLISDVVEQGLVELASEEDLHGKIVDSVERELITQVMRMCNSVQTKAATKLGINRNTLHKKLKEYELDES